MAEEKEPAKTGRARKQQGGKEIADKPQKPVEAQRRAPLWSGLALAGLLVSGLIIAAYTYWGERGESTPGTASALQIRTLADRLAQVEGQRARIDALENGLNRLDATRNSLAALQEKQESDVHRLETALRTLRPQEAADIKPLENRIAALEQRLASQAQAEQDRKLRSTDLLLGIAMLAQAIDKGRPFPAELAVVKNSMEDASLVAPLESLAPSGVAPLPLLRTHFEKAASQITHPPVPDNAAFSEKIWNFLSSLVSVRSTGTLEGMTVEAILARTDLALQSGDVQKAEREFNTLPEDRKALVPDFARNLSASATAEKVLQNLLLASTDASGKKAAP